MHQVQKQAKSTISTVRTPLFTVDSTQKPNQIFDSLWSVQHTEAQQVDWLILHFNRWFSYSNIELLRSDSEPEYFPAKNQSPAQIKFAHGFFNSALHEISHWCIAGPARRTLPDLGYWYAPDGRTQEQQMVFEQVEIKPQAIEWLFSKAFNRKFRVSLDNLTGEGGDGSQFKADVYTQVQRYFNAEAKLPPDALYFIQQICACTRANRPLYSDEFQREMLD